MSVDEVELLDLLRRLVAIPEGPFDYEQGLCYWCDGGWTGEDRKAKPTGEHRSDCAYAVAIARLGKS